MIGLYENKRGAKVSLLAWVPIDQVPRRARAPWDAVSFWFAKFEQEYAKIKPKVKGNEHTCYMPRSL